jgi:hypothetical protein
MGQTAPWLGTLDQPLQARRELREKLAGRDTDGLLHVAERILHDLVLYLAEHQADARLVHVAPELGVDGDR